MTYTKEHLKQMLADMGIRPDDTLLIHSSMKAIGDVEGGADTVLDAWMEYLSEGLLLLPTHTWKQMGPEHRVFDPETEPSCVGILTELFRKRPGVVRSLHPTHSMAAFGRRSREYVKGEENLNTPCGPGGCFARLEEEKAKILLLGVGHARNTFIHAVEESIDVPERLTAEPEEFFIKMADGSRMRRPMYRHYNRKNAHISEDFPKLERAFYENGAAKQVKFGDADCILCDAAKTAEVVRRVLSHEINCIIDRDVIPEEWWKING
ncbi:MAG: AAC(3) family N-acetyltransferase [Lachnospiraceae bacterium]|nr:AAC(3) family N-acetyltransferase [Lachnospiraceae bacterium]